MLRIPLKTKKIQRSPAGRDQSTGADSSLCNKSGSSSTLTRLVCASGGRRTMENSMRYGARCSTQSTSSPLPAPKMEKSLAHCQTLRPWSVPPAGDERWQTLSSMVHDAVCSISSLTSPPSAPNKSKFIGFQDLLGNNPITC